MANYINADWIESLTATSERSRRLSPPAFRYQLTELARKAGKRVVLPEGDEPRTVKAAAICAERGIATCVLLGNPDEINRVAAAQGVELGAGIEIVDPEVVRESYVGRLVELRKNKGMTEAVAREQLEDNVVLGTLMLEQDEVDGLVSGAVHTTANTIRPSAAAADQNRAGQLAGLLRVLHAAAGTGLRLRRLRDQPGPDRRAAGGNRYSVR